LHDDKSGQALAHEAELVELIAAFLATQKLVEYVAPTAEWAAAEVDMDVDVAQEQQQRIPAGPHSLTAETFELIQQLQLIRAYSGPTTTSWGITVCSTHLISFADRASALKAFGVGEAIHRVLPMLSEDEQSCARHPGDAFRDGDLSI
jgi:hypothetical protein